MRPLRRRVGLACAMAIPISILVASACGDSTATPGDTPDAGVGFDATTSPSIDAAAAQPDDAATTPVDSGDASLEGTAVGLRVLFLGAEHSFGADDESSLRDMFAADTTLQPQRVTSIPTFDAALLADADVVVLDKLPRAFDETEAQVLYDWVSAGHGLLSLVGYGGAPDSHTNSLVAKFGIVTSGGAGGNVILPPSTAHPVTNGVSGLRFYGGYKLANSLDASATQLFEYTGAPAGFASTHGAGRAVFYGDEWILLDVEVVRVDDAGAKPTERFWKNALLWVGGRID